MIIVHICLGNFYVEGMGYQENLITRFHSEQGHLVYVLTSDFAFDGRGKAVKKTNKSYTNQYGVNVKVLEKKSSFLARYGIYKGLYEELMNLNPDIVFTHGGTFLSLRTVTRYCKKHDCDYYIDQHGDYYNSPVDSLRGRLVYKYLYGHYMRKAAPYVKRFWGVTPWRCQYLHDVIGIQKDKIGLLIMGGDDEKIHFNEMPQLRNDIRKELELGNDDFVIVTGGKIDRSKNIHLLMQAVSELNGKVKLIVFGQPNDEMKNEIAGLSDNVNIRFLGWIPSDKAYDYFLAADLAVFPGTHSVLWEQACACGIPCVFKNWDGMHHIDVGGNCKFLYKDSTEEIKSVLSEIADNKAEYLEMKNVAEKEKNSFFYSKIAKVAIGDLNEYKRN